MTFFCSRLRRQISGCDQWSEEIWWENPNYRTAGLLTEPCTDHGRPWLITGLCFWQVSSVNYYFEREVKHLEYVQQRKLIREEEKKEIALELVKKKTVSEISSPASGKVSRCSSHRSPVGSTAFCFSLWESRGHFFDFLDHHEWTTCWSPSEILSHFYLFIACGWVLGGKAVENSHTEVRRHFMGVSAPSC